MLFRSYENQSKLIDLDEDGEFDLMLILDTFEVNPNHMDILLVVDLISAKLDIDSFGYSDSPTSNCWFWIIVVIILITFVTVLLYDNKKLKEALNEYKQESLDKRIRDKKLKEALDNNKKLKAIIDKNKKLKAILNEKIKNINK